MIRCKELPTDLKDGEEIKDITGYEGRYAVLSIYPHISQGPLYSLWHIQPIHNLRSVSILISILCSLDKLHIVYFTRYFQQCQWYVCTNLDFIRQKWYNKFTKFIVRSGSDAVR